MVQDSGRFDHLDHEGGPAGVQFIMGADTGEYPIYQTNASFTGRYETAHLGHEHNQRHLAQIGRFPGHVRTGDNLNALLLTKGTVVGHESF